MIFASSRQAIAYLYAHHRGPTAARPKYDDAPGGTGRVHWDGTMVGAMLYGPREQGCCGVVRGGALDRALRDWATHAESERTAEIRAVDRRMRAILRQHGLLAERRPAPKVRRWVDPESRVWARLVAAAVASEKTACADGLDLPRLP